MALYNIRKGKLKHSLVVLDKFYPRSFSEEVMSKYSFWFVGGNGNFYWFDRDESIWLDNAEDFYTKSL